MPWLALVALLFAEPATENWQLIFLRPDPARKTLAQAEATKLQAAHMAHIQKMAGDGFLKAAGPFEDTPTTISGIFLFRMPTPEAARELAAQDPTVQTHRNQIEVHTFLLYRERALDRGPHDEYGNLSDIVVFRPGDFDAAQKLMAADPAVHSGALRMEAHRWWSAAQVLPWE